MNDQHYYDRVAEELQNKVLTPGLWTRAVAESAGNLDAARAMYIRFRVSELKDQERAEVEQHKRKAELDAQHQQSLRQRSVEQKRLATHEMQANIRDRRAATCINCGRECAPKRLDKCYLIIGVGLCVFLIIPGVLFLLLAKGHIFRCEHCGTKLYTQWI